MLLIKGNKYSALDGWQLESITGMGYCTALGTDKEHFPGHPFKVRATVVPDTNLTQFIQYTQIVMHFSFSLSD